MIAITRSGAVGFIDWLGRVGFFAPIAAKNKFWNATERNRANNCYGADPFPSRRAERQKSHPIPERDNSAKDEKRSGEVTVNTATAESVHQTRYTHECERRYPQNRSQGRRLGIAKREGKPR